MLLYSENLAEGMQGQSRPIYPVVLSSSTYWSMQRDELKGNKCRSRFAYQNNLVALAPNVHVIYYVYLVDSGSKLPVFKLFGQEKPEHMDFSSKARMRV